MLLRQKLPKVNKELALKLMEEGDDEAELSARKKKGKVGAHVPAHIVHILLVWSTIDEDFRAVGWVYIVLVLR